MGYQITNAHRSAFNTASFTFNGNALAANGTYQEVARYTEVAGLTHAVGYGSATTQDAAQGRAYMQLQNSTPVAITGAVRIDIHDAQDRYVRTVFQARTEDLLTSETDRRQMIPLPMTGVWVKDHSSIVLKVKPDAANTPDSAQCHILLDMTEADLNVI